MAYRDTILADSPVSYWRLDEASGNALDSVGSNPGTVNGPLTQQAPGLIEDPDTAMSGAANGWVEVANSPSLNPAAFSVEFWVNATLTSSSQCPICKGAGGQWYITLNTGQTTFNNGWNGWQIQGHPLTSGETHHIVGVYAPPTMALYIDGALAASASVVGNSGPAPGR